MVDSKYQKGKIYKIVDNGYSKMYIGSTIQSLANRMSRHRKDYLRYKDGKPVSYTSSYVLFDDFGVENCKIELVEVFPCNSKEELRKQEGVHIKSNECVNEIVNERTRDEWYNDNKEVIQEKLRQYAVKNKETIK